MIVSGTESPGVGSYNPEYKCKYSKSPSYKMGGGKGRALQMKSSREQCGSPGPKYNIKSYGDISSNHNISKAVSL